MLPRLFKASEHLQSEDFDKAVKAKVEIHVRSSDSRPGRERIILYSPASYPSSIKVFPWYQLVQSSDDFDLSNVLKPYVLLHKVKRHDRIRASSIYSKYAHPNLKLILIMSSNITQKHLDSDRELIDCPITIVIIPHKFKHELKDFIADATKNYEASVKPVISTKVHYFFTTANVDDVIFKRRMHEFIQERTCITMESIDDPSGKSLRLLKWILDKVNLTFLDNQFELYSVTHEDVIQHVLDLLVEKDHIDSVFSKDFIFYFCFANILHCFYSLQAYPESLKLLVYKCVTKLKEIKPTDIARYQQEFIDKGSFKIYDSHVTEINVFHLAAKSFITVSQGYLMIYPSSAAVEYAYVKILSVSIAIKFYNSCSMLKKIQKLWFKEVLQARNNFLSYKTFFLFSIFFPRSCQKVTLKVLAMG
ncbi:PREDICTED: uncharacterized protein LOC109583969 [Amphimedon queenslandica]|uniref:Uncharacterized protein n=1 Tax=Amphimedon queenslandica TaxID=400682 RepID=A0AAN0JE93_AMPQE|nr:PREDICTED: uncharacterized protein LOC109583969 [Amphimedon queenslandica]|eukprot:XP_019855072.1 PREDICTED: uncharacterized protein LOC109583969 [Amphimedon queenslandica]